jgi:hypothetical protein
MPQAAFVRIFREDMEAGLSTSPSTATTNA